MFNNYKQTLELEIFELNKFIKKNNEILEIKSKDWQDSKKGLAILKANQDIENKLIKLNKKLILEIEKQSRPPTKIELLINSIPLSLLVALMTYLIYCGVTA